MAQSYEKILKPYACKASETRGRLFPEPESPSRSAFQRDRDRIIHCTAFRRLKHKTQVFVHHEGDHYRTRLTHSIEVAQIARSICRVLGVDEDLGEALALAHDFGHTPFGHAGEEALNDVMKNYGGFDHNAQTIRLVTLLEKRYAAFDGLNLTWESLEGLAKHNGPLAATEIDPRNPSPDIPFGIAEYLPQQDLELHTFAGMEAQIAANADDIAYNNHDIDDGLRAGLFSIRDLSDISIVGHALDAIRKTMGDIAEPVLISELVRHLINNMVSGMLRETARRLGRLNPRSPRDVRQAGEAMAGFDPDLMGQIGELKSYLGENMYNHPAVIEKAAQAKQVVKALFSLYIDAPEKMPVEWSASATGPGTMETARVAADYIAGMTDGYAFRAHATLFNNENQ